LNYVVYTTPPTPIFLLNMSSKGAVAQDPTIAEDGIKNPVEQASAQPEQPSGAPINELPAEAPQLQDGDAHIDVDVGSSSSNL
jgi:hypothetical protein